MQYACFLEQQLVLFSYKNAYNSNPDMHMHSCRAAAALVTWKDGVEGAAHILASMVLPSAQVGNA
jgi:hypothetical protein